MLVPVLVISGQHCLALLWVALSCFDIEQHVALAWRSVIVELMHSHIHSELGSLVIMS